jgi:hypothetical protein
MSSQNPYEQLGVTEASSFDEIQDARNRLFAEYEGDRKQLESIEAAYDAVLMDRLRLRQEGKIKVPDRIRFPEKMVQPAPAPAPSPVSNGPGWLQRLIDTPSRTDILLPAAILAPLTAVLFFYINPSPQLIQLLLLVGVGSSFYFLFRKERKFGRAILLTLIGLVFGLLVGMYALGPLLHSGFPNFSMSSEALATVFTFLILWLISSFLR